MLQHYRLTAKMDPRNPERVWSYVASLERALDKIGIVWYTYVHAPHRPKPVLAFRSLTTEFFGKTPGTKPAARWV